MLRKCNLGRKVRRLSFPHSSNFFPNDAVDKASEASQLSINAKGAATLVVDSKWKQQE